MGELQTECVAEKDNTQHQRQRTGDDMRIKYPLVVPEEITVPPPQKVGFKIWRKILAVVQYDTRSDPDDQQGCEWFPSSEERC